MSNCQNVNYIPTDTRLISMDFPTSLYEKIIAITIPIIILTSVLGLFTPQTQLQKNGHCMYVRDLKECLWIY